MFFCFRLFLIFLVSASLIENLSSSAALAETKIKRSSRNPELEIPPALRPRVNFWIDIFGRYTKAQVVIHHRRFPQVRFGVLDIAQDTMGMNNVLFDAYKDRALKAKLREVREDIAFLATGEAAKTAQQKTIEHAMRVLGPGVAKYKRIVEDPDLVRGQSGISEKTKEAVERSGRYLPIIEDIFVNEFGLPVELTRLPFVESSFDYKAYSSVAAAGIWQFMPKTALSYMRVSKTVDERLDPIESTRAAAKYLKSAYARLGTWPLALTSYNHGVGGVLKKVRSFGTTSITSLIENSSEPPPFGFASANFFPSFLAAKEIYELREDFFPTVIMEPSLQISTIRLSKATLISDVKRKLGISEMELRATNYALSERIWRGQSAIPAGYNLKVPREYQSRLIKAGLGDTSENFNVDSTSKIEPIIVTKSKTPIEETGVETASNQTKVVVPAQPKIATSYTVKAGDTLYSISRKFGVTVPELKSANNIKGSSVFLGKVLNIPTLSGTTLSKPKALPAQDALVKLYTVKKGDTLGAIAKRFGIPLAKLAQKNGLSVKKPVIKPGQVLKMP